MNRNVIVVLCVVLAITALLLLGKKTSKPKAVDPTKQNVSGSPVASGTDPAIGSLAPEFS